jgi:hypothetical protein
VNVSIGLPGFLTVACYVVIFGFLWRSLLAVLYRTGHTQAAGAGAWIF